MENKWLKIEKRVETEGSELPEVVGGAGTRRFVDLPASDDGMRGVCVCMRERCRGERDGGGNGGPWKLEGLICSLIYS